MGFKREEDSHFLYSICEQCGERLTFSAAGARPEEIEKAEAEHVCPDRSVPQESRAGRRAGDALVPTW